MIMVSGHSRVPLRIALFLLATTLLKYPGSVLADTSEGCPGRPVFGDWALIADPMVVAGVPSWLGGGVAEIEIKGSPVDDCEFMTTFPGLGPIYFKKLAGADTKAAIYGFITNYLMEQSSAGLGNIDPAQSAEVLNDILKKEVDDFTANQDSDVFAGENGRAAPAVSFYGGIPAKEPRIFWFIGFVNPGAMWSIQGFSHISEGGAAMAPPHLQKHFWTRATVDKKLKKNIKKMMQDAKLSNLGEILGEAYRPPPSLAPDSAKPGDK